MNRESIREIIKDVFHQFDSKTVGDWQSFRCPLATWTHDRGIDRSPSAGILINDNGTSIFNCYVCGNPCPLHTLFERYADYTGEDLDSLIEQVENEEYLGPARFAQWDDPLLSEESLPMPIDEAVYLGLYDSAEGHPYLASRGIGRETTRRLGLLFDDRGTTSDSEPRILFPVRGMEGLLYGFSGRAIRASATLKVRDYHGLKKSAMVLGAHLAADAGAVLAVEGLFDYARAHECGYAGCALMHSNLTAAQADILRDIDKPVYTFMDDDSAGKKGVDAIGRLLVEHTPVMRVTYPRRHVTHDFVGNRLPNPHYVKDPGELLPEEFDDMIVDARIY